MQTQLGLRLIQLFCELVHLRQQFVAPRLESLLFLLQLRGSPLHLVQLQLVVAQLIVAPGAVAAELAQPALCLGLQPDDFSLQRCLLGLVAAQPGLVLFEFSGGRKLAFFEGLVPLVLQQGQLLLLGHERGHLAFQLLRLPQAFLLLLAVLAVALLQIFPQALRLVFELSVIFLQLFREFSAERGALQLLDSLLAAQQFCLKAALFGAEASDFGVVFLLP